MSITEKSQNASTLYAEGKFEEALALFDELTIEIDSSEKEVLGKLFTNRAVTLTALGRNEDAIESFSTALSYDTENPQTLFNRAMTLKGINRLEDCVKDFNAVIEMVPGHYDALCGKSEALSSLGKISEAEETATAAIAVDDKRWEAYADRAFARILHNNPYAASEDYENSFSRGNSVPEHQSLYRHSLAQHAVLCDREGKPEEAVECLQKVLKTESDTPNTEIHMNLGLILMKLKKLEAARESLGEVLKAEPQNSNALCTMGSSLVMEENFEEAVVYLRKAVNSDNDLTVMPRGDVIFNLGLSLMKTNKKEESFNAFKDVLKIDPGHENAAKGMKILEQQMKKEKALKDAQENREKFLKRSSKTTDAAPTPPPPPPGGPPSDSSSSEESTKEEEGFLEEGLKKSRKQSMSVQADFPARRSRRLSASEVPDKNFSLEELTARPYPEGVDPSRRESYLTDDDFSKAFGISKTEFYGLAKWKQVMKKKALSLF